MELDPPTKILRFSWEHVKFRIKFIGVPKKVQDFLGLI